ncbi:unnamed protein product [Cladocopium goreaui]|uniref:Sec24B protein n=1 Tax=Cladocopium goreaui TaxID=2562237 RepID=A0A9P1G9Y9_9DINO|nr:unnamed protein product [Cladocopium goreaui]
MKVFSGCAMDAVLFSSTAEPVFNDEKPECSPALASWKYVRQAVITGLVSTLVSDAVIWMLSYILSAAIEERPEWTTKDRIARLRWSRWRMRCFLCFAASYNLACLIYVYLFIANAREVDSTQLILAILWGLLQDGLGTPLVMATILAIALNLVLCFFPEVRGEVENRWLAPAPTEDRSSARDFGTATENPKILQLKLQIQTKTNKNKQKQTNKQANKQTSKQANKQTSKQANKQTSKQANKQTSKAANKQTNKRTNERTNEQTNNHTHTHALDKKWIIEVIRWELNPLTCN